MQGYSHPCLKVLGAIDKTGKHVLVALFSHLFYYICNCNSLRLVLPTFNIREVSVLWCNQLNER